MLWYSRKRPRDNFPKGTGAWRLTGAELWQLLAHNIEPGFTYTATHQIEICSNLAPQFIEL